MTVVVVAVVAALGACQQDSSQPLCVTVPKSEAAAALSCVAADLPACQRDRQLDTAQCDTDRDALRGALDAAITRAERLADLLDRAPAPPVVPWYARPGFVAPAAVAATLGLVLLADRW